MKREREVDNISMANYLMLLSGSSSKPNRVFECKTCNRKFTSFQALGGHRASHKKPRLMGESDGDNQVLDGSPSPPKPKTHECSICGLEFAIGQALGGHMRRHRASSSSSSSNGNMHTKPNNNNNTTKRLLFPDLNLTPLENDLEFLKIAQATPLIHCFN